MEIDPAQELFNAAQASQINPQVLLGTLQKEQSAVTRPTPLPVDRLKLIMGFGTPTTIIDSRSGMRPLNFGAILTASLKVHLNLRQAAGKSVSPRIRLIL